MISSEGIKEDSVKNMRSFDDVFEKILAKKSLVHVEMKHKTRNQGQTK